MKRVILAASAIVALAACGGSGSPTSPEPALGGLPSPTTASISGTIAGASSAQLLASTAGNAAAAGMTVTIAGTTLSTSVNSLGQFLFSTVPPGAAVVLRFDGAGASAQLPIGTLTAGETLTLTVTVNGGSAAIQSQTRGNGKEIEGRIESILPGTIVVAGRTVTVDAATTIRRGETVMTFAELIVGMRVHVKGTPTGSGETATTAASQIIVQNVNTSVPVNLQGTVSNLTGTASAFELKVQGRTVKGGATTTFKGGKSPSFAGLANGGKVHVKGTQQNGYVQATTVTLQGK